MSSMPLEEDQKTTGLEPGARRSVGSDAAGAPAEVHAKWLAEMRQRNQQAFAMVIEHFSPVLTRTAYLYLGDGHDAEDAVQETFLAAWDAVRRTTSATNLRAWLLGILINRCRKHIRSASRRRRRDLQAFERRMKSLPDRTDDADQKLSALWIALGTLTPEHREAVILRYHEGFSVTAAGEAMGVPPGTVKSRCHVALTQLRSIMESGA